MEVGLYIHIPFCQKKCPYCDFYSVPFRGDEETYLKALLREIELLPFFLEKELGLNNFRIITLYVGGGTPSLFSPLFYEKLFQKLAQSLPFSPSELTIEVNPETLSLEKAKGFKKVGFNRISLGVQSFSQRGLKFLQRTHSLNDIKRSLHFLELASFENFSMDFIYAWPGQGIKTLEKELTKALSFSPPHLSFYELTLYPNTPFYEKYGHALPYSYEDRAVKLGTFICNYLTSQGYISYEISNYAKEGFEAQHNLLYWRVKSYLGLGAGAVSRINSLRYKNPDDLKQYYEALLLQQRLSYTPLERLDHKEMVKELIFMGLRLKEGISLNRIRQYSYDINREALELLSRKNLIYFSENKIALTERGKYLHNQVVKFLWDNLEERP